MRTQRLLASLLILALLLAGLPPGVAAQDEACFAETGFCIRGRFLAYWRENGDLALNGFPLSEERRETLEDGVAYTVQYFERVRLEYHPEHAPPHDILLGQFGRRVINYLPEDRSSPQPGRVYFPETGHNLFARFLEYWQQNGGLARFGYPLTEEIERRFEEEGTGRVINGSVQYFERARFEYHPENKAPYDVLLGQFGREILAENDLLGIPSGSNLGILYISNEEVRRRLSKPRTPGTEAPGAYQAFERGAMLYRGDVRGIYVLCGDQRAGNMLPGDAPRTSPFPDTWAEGQDPGGGLGPAPGQYQPRFGFGKLWRENQRVRDCLGYAVTVDETAYRLRVQPFSPAGMLLSATTPEGRFIYVVDRTGWNTPSSCSAFECRPRYERFPDPAR